MVHRLASQQHPDDRTLFRRLADEFEEDQLVVRALLARLGSSGRSMKRVAGVASGTVVSAMVGGEPGDLALFRTLEALSVGIQGKRCMWRVLQDLPLAPVRGVDFVALEAKAVRQWDAIEERRRGLVPRTFSVTDPLIGKCSKGHGIAQFRDLLTVLAPSFHEGRADRHGGLVDFTRSGVALRLIRNPSSALFAPARLRRDQLVVSSSARRNHLREVA